MKALNSALVKFHAQLKPVAKDSENPFFKSDYLSLSGILDAVRPILAANGLAILQPMRVEGDKTILITRLVHESGEEMISEMILPQLADPQRFGSLLSYYKRYQLQALLGISTKEEDDDANHASQPLANRTETAQVQVLASDAQKGLLTRLGIKFAANISKAEASKLIEQNQPKRQ
jgi:hypothetical protein